MFNDIAKRSSIYLFKIRNLTMATAKYLGIDNNHNFNQSRIKNTHPNDYNKKGLSHLSGFHTFSLTCLSLLKLNDLF